MSLKDSILQAQDRPLVPVEVPEWGLTVYVRTMTLGEMEGVQSFIDAAKDDADIQVVAKTVVRIIYDENGDRVFNDDEVELVRNKSHKSLTRIVNAFNDVNGLDDEMVDEAGKD